MAKNEITQALLMRVATNHAQLDELKKSIEADEAALFAALKEARPIQKGLLTAVIESKPGRRTTAWKERAIEFVDETRGEGEGEKWAARVIAATKPGDPSEKVVVKIAA